MPEFFCFFSVALYLLLRDGYFRLSLMGALLYLIQITCLSPLTAIEIFFGILSCVIAFLLQNHTRAYQTLEQKFYHTWDDSQERNLLLSHKNKALAEKQDWEIYTATLRERNRIAREIHDNVGHVLSRSILLVGALKTVNKEEALTPMLEHLDLSLNSAMDSIRSSVHDLHDESVNLEETIGNMIGEFVFCPINLTYDMSRNVPKEVKYCLISILREALSNIIKHSRATEASVLIREHPALYQLCISDNGNVAAPVSPGSFSSGSGMGLSNMQERTRSLNGTFQILQEHGFQIFITIPKDHTGKE